MDDIKLKLFVKLAHCKESPVAEAADLRESTKS
jgi:hypothetical protein